VQQGLKLGLDKGARLPAAHGPFKCLQRGDCTDGRPRRAQVSSDESERLIKMEGTLHQRVIGQEEAVVAISRAIRRARVGLKNPNRPIASFIFSGPTGVGKSELAKTLASYYFGSEDAMVRLDMSEFMERHTVSKLIGSPPGARPRAAGAPARCMLLVCTPSAMLGAGSAGQQQDEERQHGR